MPNKLKNLNITKVDLVPEGANPDAFVTMYKSKTPIRKSGEAESFAAKLKDIKLDDVVRQIWQYTESLSSSLISILRDDNVTDKKSAMDKSLEEFYGAATLSTEKWSGGSVSDYVATGSEEPQTATIVKALKAETLGILKSNNEGADNDMKIEDIDIRIQWGRKIVMPAMIDTPRIRERSRLKLVRFYIESGYGPEGIAQYKNQLFETEIRKIFSDLGFEITRKTPEYSLSATKGHTNLYCHPTHIMGLCDASSIETIRQNLSASQTFILTSSETIHEIYDITPEQEMKYYHQFFNGFVHLVLIGIFRTKRRNLYKSKDMMYDIGRTIKIRTLRAEQGYKFGLLAEKFVEEIYQKMVENGVLIESPCHRKCRASTSKDKITAKS